MTWTFLINFQNPNQILEGEIRYKKLDPNSDLYKFILHIRKRLKIRYKETFRYPDTISIELISRNDDNISKELLI